MGGSCWRASAYVSTLSSGGSRNTNGRPLHLGRLHLVSREPTRLSRALPVSVRQDDYPNDNLVGDTRVGVWVWLALRRGGRLWAIVAISRFCPSAHSIRIVSMYLWALPPRDLTENAAAPHEHEILLYMLMPSGMGRNFRGGPVRLTMEKVYLAARH